MENKNLSVRVSFASREIEVSGTQDQVRDWMERLDPIVQLFAGGRGSGSSERLPPARSSDGQRATDPPEEHVPGVFGEYLHQFPASTRDIDKALIAAYFVQTNNSDKSFATKQVTELLQEQNYKLTNPSQCIKQNVSKRYAFPMGGGRFRVSQPGIEHLAHLRSQGDNEPNA